MSVSRSISTFCCHYSQCLTVIRSRRAKASAAATGVQVEASMRCIGPRRYAASACTSGNVGMSCSISVAPCRLQLMYCYVFLIIVSCSALLSALQLFFPSHLAFPLALQAPGGNAGVGMFCVVSLREHQSQRE